MGRRKGQINQMGHSLLVKEKQRRPGPRGSGDSFLHTTDLQDGVNYNRINFQSVTEQNNLEDFLTTAEMAGRDFTAERQNISVITNPGQGIRLTTDDMNNISKAQQQHRDLLRIPRRPHWDEFTTKEELLLTERDSFTEWRRQLKMLEEQQHIELTPYEKNLDFWRQLWRVIERSDVVVQIVDARNPLLFRCEDLETYTKEVNSQKTVMLLVNKADYLNHLQRTQWMEYFNKHGIQAVFFSAKTEIEKHENVEPEQQASELEGICGADADSDSGLDEDDSDDEVKENNDVQNVVDEEKDIDACETDHTEASSHPVSTDKENLTENCDNINLNSLSLQESPPQSDVGNKSKTVNSEQDQSASEHLIQDSSESTENKNVLLLENKADIVTADELMDIFRMLAHPSSTARSVDVKTIGMVGYPNVGKSSTINVILKEKKLAVSATPGRTKHLQTLYVDENLMLCDCPGLVFPSFVATKAHLVINGILPIDELRDHVSPVTLICDYIPRNVLGATYSIMIPRPSMDDDADRPPTAEELLNAYGAMRGFMTPRGIPDGPRSSRYLLKDFVKGKLLYCNPPPGISGPEFQDKERALELEAARPVIKTSFPRIQSDIDKEFFQKRHSNINSKGVTGVKGFVRVDCLKSTSRGTEEVDGSSYGGSIAGSSMSIDSSAAGVHKPWKKHNNRNKKEKLRRLHKDLDVH